MSSRYLKDVKAARHDVEALSAIVTKILTTDFASLKELEEARLIEIGIIARDSGLRYEAVKIFDRISAANPTDIASRYEMAVLLLHEGNHLQSLHELQKILAHNPHEERTNLFAARVLHALGAHHQASICLNNIQTNKMATSADWGQKIQVVHEFGRYIAQFPKQFALDMAEQMSISPLYCSAKNVTSYIFAALRDKSSFSLIRAGDGEGAFLFISNTDEAQYPNLYKYNRTDRARVWFADTVDANQTEFLNETFRITDVILNADVIGMPYYNWLYHEHKILSMTGISSLTNLLRANHRLVNKMCTQMIHLELHKTGLLYDIMRSQKKIGLISCHKSLPDRLISVFGFEEVDYHHVPGEKGHSHLLSDDAVTGIHWPDRYKQIMQSLNKPLNGTLYIVAAGLLGKLYCDQIKKYGGVALDIGSVADGWVGSQTRPGLEALKIG